MVVARIRVTTNDTPLRHHFQNRWWRQTGISASLAMGWVSDGEEWCELLSARSGPRWSPRAVSGEAAQPPVEAPCRRWRSWTVWTGWRRTEARCATRTRGSPQRWSPDPAALRILERWYTRKANAAKDGETGTVTVVQQSTHGRSIAMWVRLCTAPRSVYLLSRSDTTFAHQ